MKITKKTLKNWAVKIIAILIVVAMITAVFVSIIGNI